MSTHRQRKRRYNKQHRNAVQVPVKVVQEPLLVKVMTVLHIHISPKLLHGGAHCADMAYLGLVAIFSHGPYIWAAGALFVIKVVAVLQHEEV